MIQYCYFEMFQARCATRHEVVVMAASSYGRQETGRCLPPDSVIESWRHDPRYFGCSADVLYLADRKCSGLPRCDVAIPDSDFERITPCYKDSRKYLEAKYDCVRGRQYVDRHLLRDFNIGLHHPLLCCEAIKLINVMCVLCMFYFFYLRRIKNYWKECNIDLQE